MSEQNARDRWVKFKRRPLGILPIYDTVEFALWSGLIAVVILFTVFVLPRLPEIRRQQEAARLLQIEAEQQFYCHRLGNSPGTDAFGRCIIELQAYRKSIEKRLAEDAEF